MPVLPTSGATSQPFSLGIGQGGLFERRPSGVVRHFVASQPDGLARGLDRAMELGRVDLGKGCAGKDGPERSR